MWPYQRKSFFIFDKFLQLYGDDFWHYAKSSQNGTTWSTAYNTNIVYSSGLGRNGSYWYDGTYLHCVGSQGGFLGSQLWYRRFLVNFDGSLTPSAASQLVLSTAGESMLWPSIAVDSDGYPFISYIRQDAATNRYPYVTKSSTNDGTWVTDAGYPFQLSVVADNNWRAGIIPLNNLRMYVLYARNANACVGRLYNAGAWGAAEAASVTVMGAHSHCFSITNDGDNVVLTFLSGFNLIYRYRTFGVGWGAEEVIHVSAETRSAPVVGLVNSVPYAFWIEAGSIWYMKREGGVWDATPNLIVSDNMAEDVFGDLNDMITCSPSGTEMFALSYINGGLAGPWNVRHVYLSFSEPALGTPRAIPHAGI